VVPLAVSFCFFLRADANSVRWCALCPLCPQCTARTSGRQSCHIANSTTQVAILATWHLVSSAQPSIPNSTDCHHGTPWEVAQDRRGPRPGDETRLDALSGRFAGPGPLLVLCCIRLIISNDFSALVGDGDGGKLSFFTIPSAGSAVAGAMALGEEREGGGGGGVEC
jgi:hypothetical protein